MVQNAPMTAPPSQNTEQDARLERARGWVNDTTGIGDTSCKAIAGDASHRRYFRLSRGERSWVLMDAPPGKEDIEPFVKVAARLLNAGVRVPRVLQQDRSLGFLLLEDLGDTLLRDVLTDSNVEDWVQKVCTLLDALASEVEPAGLPSYDRARLVKEMELFPRWYLSRHRDINWDDEGADAWESTTTELVSSALEQPRCFVHRDFHSCNLMVLDEGSLGVIDFQDAVHGPLTYDLVSMIWDRYIAWPREQVENWMDSFRERVSPETDPVQWRRWCDLMGLQRNFKIVGIFARLHYRDGKDGYLDMIPQFWGYLQDVLPRYPEFSGLHDWLARHPCAP